MKKLTLLVFGALYYITNALAIAQPEIGERRMLKIGDSLPDVVLSTMINYPKPSVRISDFNDKLLILDFWTTWCVPCVQAFPKLDSLQRKFQGQIQILPVTWEKREQVEKFFARIKRQRDWILPSAVDTLLHKNFITSSGTWAGQYVWIMQGKIIGFSIGKKTLTESNIKLALANQRIVTDVKNEILDEKVIPEVLDRPLLPSLITKQSNNIATKYSSTFTSFMKGFKSQRYVKLPRVADSTCAIRMVNQPLSVMYSYAYQVPPYCEVLEVKDLEYFNPSPDKRDSSNLYCYELIVPIDFGKDRLFRTMQEDLKRIFGYTVERENRKVKCAILKGNGNKNLYTTGSPPLLESNNFYIELINQPFERLTSLLEYYIVSPDIPFFLNETAISGNIDITIDADWSDYRTISLLLKKYGLDLIVEERYLPMFVFRD